ncbi:hypothetical protein OG429_25975 [Streptomyces sp. NBC_00190]|uniref:hypothetical protein n=1 Tax=Streptomyces sp. NBC_00190 TaxID=2903634 RepID=UPI002E2B0DCC|nr:hypothetical protein [Streptomyces sp. NBC_00190]
MANQDPPAPDPTPEGEGQAQQQDARWWLRERGRLWAVPPLFGISEARSCMGLFAAPFLAGFTLTAALVTLSLDASKAPLLNWALLSFLLSAVLFVGSVHATLWARSYLTTPKQMLEWFPDDLGVDRRRFLIAEQRTHADGFNQWIKRAVNAYDAAVILLLVGLTIVVVPPGSHPSKVRIAAVVVGVIACATEALWSFTSRCVRRREKTRRDRVSQGLPNEPRTWWETIFRPETRQPEP